MKLAILFSLALALLFAQQQRVVRPDTSTQRVSGQPPKLILALGDVSTTGNQHDSVSHALVTMEGVGLRAGLFDTLIRTDTQLVTKQAVTTLNGTLTFYRNLLDFDAVLLFVGGNPRLTTQQKTDLLSFVHDDGKGLVVIHSSVCAFGDWPEWKEMIGLAALPESERPGVSEEMAVRVLAPDFPPMRMFSPSFRIRDKFVHASFADSEAVRVLATAGADVPAAWTTNYGKGRVFVSQFGHDDEVWDRKDVQRMVLEAVRWVMHSQAPPSKARADKSR